MHSIPRWQHIGIFVTAFAVMTGAGAQMKDEWKASKSEAAQLPMFCWGQMLDPKLEGSRFTIPDCGPGVNHYCLGLLAEVRANKTLGKKNVRIGYLNVAKSNTQYTLSGIRDYPQCSVREHAQNTLARVQGQLRMLGAK